MTAIIYKITNQLTNKSYIGWTSQSFDARWHQHKKLAQKNQDNRPFYNAIRKYGIDCWTQEILEEVNDKNLAKQKIGLLKMIKMLGKWYHRDQR